MKLLRPSQTYEAKDPRQRRTVQGGTSNRGSELLTLQRKVKHVTPPGSFVEVGTSDLAGSPNTMLSVQ
jgi:hypothetical protein